MKVLTILTQRHRQALEDVLLGLRCSTRGGLHEIKCSQDRIDIDALVVLLERIVVLEHPVYGHSLKLADMALEFDYTETRRANAAELLQYIGEYDLLHLEGYAVFRMQNYRYKLDMMMYGLIKKLKLVDSLLP